MAYQKHDDAAGHVIPEQVRARDLVGYGRTPPAFAWPDGEAWTYDRDGERAQIARAIETYERVLGSRPLGWNSRGWPSENTRGILLELGGFTYHSEGSADDVPYYEPGFSSPRDFLDTYPPGT